MHERPYISSNFTQFWCLCGQTEPGPGTATLVFKGDEAACQKCGCKSQARRYHCDCKPDSLTLVPKGKTPVCQYCKLSAGAS